jgi:tRNA pseudouridine65 synthase
VPPEDETSSGHPRLDLIQVDDRIAVVCKASGLLVHRGWARDRVVAMTLLRDRLGRHVYPVHRLDRGTSGVLVFALDSASARALQEQFEANRVRKSYLALTRGVTDESGTIDHPLAREKHLERRPAVTDYRRLATFERYSLIEARPRSGRLHQIRRHFKHISHHLIGDVRYGKGEHNRIFRERFGLHRLALHARSIEFEHPHTGETMRFTADLPDDLAKPFAEMGFTEVLGRLGDSRGILRGHGRQDGQDGQDEALEPS